MQFKLKLGTWVDHSGLFRIKLIASLKEQSKIYKSKNYQHRMGLYCNFFCFNSRSSFFNLSNCQFFMILLKRMYTHKHTQGLFVLCVLLIANYAYTLIITHKYKILSVFSNNFYPILSFARYLLQFWKKNIYILMSKSGRSIISCGLWWLIN